MSRCHLMHSAHCRGLHAKIGDMGLSCQITGTHLLPSLCPSYSFMWASPEQIGCQALTLASDIFSFGVMPAVCSRWALTGQRAHRTDHATASFTGASLSIVMHQMSLGMLAAVAC